MSISDAAGRQPPVVASPSISAPSSSAPPGDDPHRGAVHNRLLAALAPDDLAALAPHLEEVTLGNGEVLADPGEPLADIYFPETAIMSVINRMADGAGVEVGTVGNEGLVGLAALLGAEASESQTLAQIPGTALRLPPPCWSRPSTRRPALRRLLHRYTQAYLTQVAQGAACNRLHGIEARCARWLLMTHDRVGGPTRSRSRRSSSRSCSACAGRGQRRPPARCRTRGSSGTGAAASACSTARGSRRPRASAMASCGASMTGCCRDRPQVTRRRAPHLLRGQQHGRVTQPAGRDGL
jgi:CRP-like cAMP-binding protein